MIKRNLGKNTLGDGNKMSVQLKTYDRSNHDLSYAWRSTMGVGTLVPCMKIIGLPGDTFDIEIDARVFTNPTIGPLFGNYKLQIDIFECPMRLYIAQLHNNAIDVADNMQNIKVPIIRSYPQPYNNPTEENKYSCIHPSSVLAYLGKRGFTYTETTSDIEEYNAIPLLSYWDIFANYYANKQEEDFYAISNTNNYLTFLDAIYYSPDTSCILSGDFKISYASEAEANKDNATIILRTGETIQAKELLKYSTARTSGSVRFYTFSKQTCQLWTTNNKPVAVVAGDYEVKLRLKKFKLSVLNDIREDLLKQGKAQKVYEGILGESDNPIIEIISKHTKPGDATKKYFNSDGAQSGLAIKTYQADIFTNFVNSERVKRLTNNTRVAVTNNSFSIDALNLSMKKYNLDARLAATNGTYKDWIEIGYTQNYGLRTETPLYQGGMSDIIQFESVVNTAATEENPLGEIGGKGTLAGDKKGGKLRIHCDEPCYLIGIVSITPLVDYCEGNDWDLNIDNMGQLHLPGMDGIGFEDLKTNQLAFWAKKDSAFGKTTAWQNYMTNFNKTYGDFCQLGNMAHMVLNRYVDTGIYNNNSANTSSYINPEAYNYVFAKNSLDSMNFQMQIGFGIKARRKMSARMIPKI